MARFVQLSVFGADIAEVARHSRIWDDTRVDTVRAGKEPGQKRERDLTQPIVDKLRKIIGDIATKEDFTVILEKSEQSVMWAKKEIDLTERVVKEFDKK